MDAMNGATDLALTDRGALARTSSVQIYRTPGRYLRELQKLSASQMEDASTAPAKIIALARKALT